MGGVRSAWYFFPYLCTGLFVVLPLRGNGLIKWQRTKQKLYFATLCLCGSYDGEREREHRMDYSKEHRREEEREKKGGSSWYNLSKWALESEGAKRRVKNLTIIILIYCTI